MYASNRCFALTFELRKRAVKIERYRVLKMTVIEAIKQIIQEKKNNKQAPRCAMLKDVERLYTGNAFRSEIRALINKGEVVIARTINSFSFYLKDDTNGKV